MGTTKLALCFALGILSHKMRSSVCVGILLVLAIISGAHANSQFLSRFERTLATVRFIDPNTNQMVARAEFNPLVDGKSPGTLSALESMGTFTRQKDGGTPDLVNTWVQMELNGVHSNSSSFTSSAESNKVVWAWREDSTNYYAPFFTMLVTLSDGEIIDMEWNWETGDKCGCGSDGSCKNELYCGINSKTCEKQQSSDGVVSPCDFKVYLAFQGTANGGGFCTSSNEMFSKFTALGVSNLAAQAASGASDLTKDTSGKVEKP